MKDKADTIIHEQVTDLGNGERIIRRKHIDLAEILRRLSRRYAGEAAELAREHASLAAQGVPEGERAKIVREKLGHQYFKRRRTVAPNYLREGSHYGEIGKSERRTAGDAASAAGSRAARWTIVRLHHPSARLLRVP